MPKSNRSPVNPARNRAIPRFAAIVAIFVSAIISAQTIAAETLLVIGPTESIDLAHGTLVVLGQQVRLSSQTRTFVGAVTNVANASRAGQHAIRAVDVGRTMAIWSADGASASTLLISLDRSVPGASQVYLSGIVTTVDQSRGLATVGGASIDLTSVLARGSLDLNVGDTLRILGTQPAPSGVILASDFGVDRTSGIGGTSVNGIGGTSVNGIGGTSVNGIGGTSSTG